MIFLEDLFDTLSRIQVLCDRAVMIQSINEQSNVFTHIYIDVILSLKKFLWLIYKVCSHNTVDQPAFISFVKFFQAVGKQTKGRSNKNTICLTAF